MSCFMLQIVRGSPVENGVIFGGSGHLLGVQALAIVVAAAYTAVMTWAILRGTRLLVGDLAIHVSLPL